MLTTENFLLQYDKCTDQELYQMHMNAADYSKEAHDALNLIIEKRGGLDTIFEQYQFQQQLAKEKQRINQETQKLYVNDTNVEFLKNLITSDLLDIHETHQIIEAKFSELRLAHEDEQIKPRTIFGSLIGAILGSIAGGILWGLQMIQMHRMFLILIAALVLISYGLIRWFTKQSKSNTVVLIATILSVVGALLIGQILFTMFG